MFHLCTNVGNALTQHFNHVNIRCLKGKAKNMTYRHTFTTSYKAKGEAQCSKGFHFFSYPNDSTGAWLKHDACGKKTTNDRLRQTVHRLIDEVVCTKQSVTNISSEYLNCCLVCLEELCTSYSNTLLPCKRFREKDVVVWMKLMKCFSIKMITNSISCLYCLDGSDMSYIAYIFFFFF